jgi:predicted nucleic acid-binding protein
MIVVSNSSPLIALGRIQRLDLMPALFPGIVVPTAVYQEVVVQGASQPGASTLGNAAWLRVQPVQHTNSVRYLLATLEQGEAEAIVLAQELQANWLLLDEIKARTAARQLGLRVIGVAGILVLAKQQGLIPTVRPLLDSLLIHHFRISIRVIHAALVAAGEQL